jgi:hypothetical protein
VFEEISSLIENWLAFDRFGVNDEESLRSCFKDLLKGRRTNGGFVELKDLDEFCKELAKRKDLLHGAKKISLRIREFLIEGLFREEDLNEWFLRVREEILDSG